MTEPTPAPTPTTAPAPTSVEKLAQGVVKDVAALDLPSQFHLGPTTVTEIGFATIFGATAGFATKKLAKTAGFAIGVGFIGVQALSHADLIKVNWPRVESLIIGKVDQDSDGKLTSSDLQIATGRMIRNLTEDLPSSTGFAAAFFLGFRYG
ncbi:FUN14 family-domain-containing protein [Blyttiomyces helicus]|uniref:FUN14 family-domain-containing protein n=1 Tax=Blyttiomyces helicus TaxID=388810 RepID=A0A4P9W7U2_9FUNG|nr:FUN14 family-domain-containing protein [Blyttiomyces helicus]|eukprot:RKO88561.1 FUN14 family-domain-containing protein [Blyttiomyces helicus]